VLGIALFVQAFIRDAGPECDKVDRLESMVSAIRAGFD
jgi:hypothetical protein